MRRFSTTRREESFLATPGPQRVPRPLTLWARTLWLGLSAFFFAGLLSCLVIAFNERGFERVVALCFAASCTGYLLFASRVGWIGAWPGFFTVVRWFLIATFLNVGGSAAMVLMFGRPDELERMVALCFVIFSLVLSLFLGLLPGTLRGLGDSSAGTVEGAGMVSPGWSALGALLVTLGVTVSLASALMASGLGDSLLTHAEVHAGPNVRKFVESQMHFLAGGLLFLPGLFCTLRSRQGLGAAHVLRGALGFTAAGTLVFFLCRLIQAGIWTDRAGMIDFRPVGQSSLAWLFGLGVLAALFLFWPAKSLTPRAG